MFYCRSAIGLQKFIQSFLALVIHLNLKFAILLLTVRAIMVALKLPQEGPKILSHISYSAGFPDFYILYYMEH